MRLIDKDYAVDTAWSIDAYHGSAREVCEMLEDAPTVDAIPVKWLEYRIRLYRDCENDLRANIVEREIELWRVKNR